MYWVIGLVPLTWAQECQAPSRCVPKEDLSVFTSLLREKRCQLGETPKFELDPIQIVIDRQGRVFFTGNDPHPYKLRMTWCSYEVEAVGKVNVIAAMRQPPIWGFRFRPKAYMGIIPSEVLYADPGQKFQDLVDAGVMVDFLYYDWVNLNAAMGYHSVGTAVGIDLSENFGASVGYGLTWGQWHHSVVTSFWFGF